MSQPDPVLSKAASPQVGESIDAKPARFPRWIKRLVLLCPFVMLGMWGWFSGRDRAIGNAMSFMVFMLTLMTVASWLAWRSPDRRVWRWRILAVLGVAIASLVMLVRLDGVTGELVPRLTFRWSAGQQLNQPSLQEVDLRVTSPDDFPQFLGPRRTAVIEDKLVDVDWNKQPPVRLWEQGIGAGWSGFVAVNGYAVTMEQRGEEEWVTCYKIDSGELCWKHVVSARHETFLGGIGPRSTPTISEGRVYASGSTGILRCLDGQTGKLIWQQDLVALAGSDKEADLAAVSWGRSSSPLVIEQQVVIPLGGRSGATSSSLLALDKETGETLWRAGERQVSYASPTLVTLAGKQQIVTVNEDTVSGHEVHNGDVLWEHAWFGQSNGAANVSQPVAVGNNRLLLSKGYQQGAMMLQINHVSTPAGPGYQAEPVWKDPTILKTKFTNLVTHGDFAYGLSDGILECVALQDGSRRWKKGRYGHGQVLRVGDQLLVLTEQGQLKLVGLDPDRLQEQARIQVFEQQCWANLCLYGDRLLVRSVDQMACYRLPVKRVSTTP